RLKESPDGLRAHAEEWDALRRELPRSAKYIVGNVGRYVSDSTDGSALVRSAVVAVAAEQFRRSRGRWPATLDELVPDYLTAVPCDPQDLKPLRLARAPDGIVVYSIGPDGTDDGGDVGPGISTTIKGRDVGIRLWDPDKRRQPPPK